MQYRREVNACRRTVDVGAVDGAGGQQGGLQVFLGRNLRPRPFAVHGQAGTHPAQGTFRTRKQPAGGLQSRHQRRRDDQHVAGCVGEKGIAQRADRAEAGFDAGTGEFEKHALQCPDQTLRRSGAQHVHEAVQAPARDAQRFPPTEPGSMCPNKAISAILIGSNWFMSTPKRAQYSGRTSGGQTAARAQLTRKTSVTQKITSHVR
jgi:hypothetical protein